MLYLKIPPLEPSRARAMIAAIESTLPTSPVSFTMVDPSGPEPLDDPAAWLIAQLSPNDMERWGGLCNADDDAFVSIGVLPLDPWYEPSGASLFEVTVDFPWSSPFVNRVADLMRALGPATDALHGRAAPTEVGAQLSRGIGRAAPAPPPMKVMRRPMLIPWAISWMNYWSQATCDALGFTPSDTRAAVFDQVIPAGDHGVVLQLTCDLLDLDRPEHVAAVTAAYQAFPIIDYNR